MHNIDSCQVFPGDPVDFVRQLLDNAETRQTNRHHTEYGCTDCNDKSRRHRRQLPALAKDLNQRPDRHNRRFDRHLHSHCDNHLNLGNIVCGTGNQTGNGKFLHLFFSAVHHVIKQLFPHRKTETGRGSRGEITAGDRKNGADQGTPQHLEANARNLGGLSGRLDQSGQLRHIIRQTQVKINLTDHKHKTEQRHQYLPAPHVLKEL